MLQKHLTKFALPVLALPRPAKYTVLALLYLGLCILTVWLAYYLRLGGFVSLLSNALWAVAVSIGSALPVFIISGLYRAIFRYSGWPALLPVVRTACIYGLLYASIFTAIGVAGVSRTMGIIPPILLLRFVGASRTCARLWLGEQYLSLLKRVFRPKALIDGAM